MWKKFRHYIKHKILSVKANGQYSFLTKKIYKKMDIDLAIRVISTDYFKEILEPLPVQTSNLQNIIVFAPHQDDEAIGCGGLLSYLSEQNCRIDVVFLTDGRPNWQFPSPMIEKRKNEARKLGQILKANIYFLDIDNVNLDVKTSHINFLVDLIKNHNYDSVFLPWLLDAPPKHRLCNFVLKKAFDLSKIDNKLQFYNYQVHTSLIPNVYFDYTKYYEKKQALINIYKSQLDFQNYSHLSKGLDSWNSRFIGWSKDPKYIEIFHQIPFKEWESLIKWYNYDIDETFRGNEACKRSYKTLLKM